MKASISHYPTVLTATTFALCAALAHAQHLRNLPDEQRRMTTNEFVFTNDLLDLTRKAVHLSSLVYEVDPLANFAVTSSGLFQGASIQVFTDEPDQALVVSTASTTATPTDNRYCFAVFRGTVISNSDDVFQNVRRGRDPVCQADTCCDVERGFNEGYNTNYKSAMEQALRTCATNCSSTSSSECPTVILTGHSQGGAIALAASLYLPDLNATVITFGQPKTVEADCPLIPSNRVYRFENSRRRPRRLLGPSIAYDPIPYIPDRNSNARHYGHQILLGDSDAAAAAVAYIGFNTEVTFRPWDVRDGFATHSLLPNRVGYLSRIEALATTSSDDRTSGSSTGSDSTSVISSTGFRDGSPCTQDMECQSNQCSWWRRRCVAA